MVLAFSHPLLSTLSACLRSIVRAELFLRALLFFLFRVACRPASHRRTPFRQPTCILRIRASNRSCTLLHTRVHLPMCTFLSRALCCCSNSLHTLAHLANGTRRSPAYCCRSSPLRTWYRQPTSTFPSRFSCLHDRVPRSENRLSTSLCHCLPGNRSSNIPHTQIH